MEKTLDQYWIDWESHVFGFGYGSGEPHIIPALKRFMELCNTGPLNTSCDHVILEKELGPAVAWLLINCLCRHGVDIIEYGTSPRYGWLGNCGIALRQYLASKTSEELIALVCDRNEYYIPCYPDACTCGNGYQEVVICKNPFWN